MPTKFEWDENKKYKNILKYGISFNDVAMIFADRDALSICYEDNSVLNKTIF